MDAFKELKEYLEEQFSRMNNRFNSIEDKLRMLDTLEDRLRMLEIRVDTMESRIHERFDRIEAETPEDVIGLLKHIDKNTKKILHDIDYLRNQVSKHDMSLHRIEQQLYNEDNIN
jgi:predicted nuclease with TOPRIM domain